MTDQLIITSLTFPDVIADTSDMSKSEWLETRHRGIGGSDAAAILGVSPWTSRYALWSDKVADKPIELAQTPAMAFGHKMEPVVADAYAESTGVDLVNDTNLYAHPEHKFMLANLDRLILGSDGKPASVLEIKTSANPYSWDDGVPPYYVSQVQHYMAVTGLPTSVVAVLLQGKEMRHYEVPRDDAYIDRLIELEAAFWDEVNKRVEPDIDGSDSTHQTIRKAYTASSGKEIDLDVSVMSLIERRADAKAKADVASEEVRKVESEIMTLLQDAEVGVVNGEPVVTWKEQSRSSVDTKRLKAEYPEIAEALTKSSSFRVLKVK